MGRGRRPWGPYDTRVDLAIEAAGPTGEGLATLDGIRYQVAWALPGERVRARIHGKRSGFRLAETEEILEPSPSRVEPRCAAFGQCGGCRWQNLALPAQAGLLEAEVRRLLEEAGAPVAPEAWRPTIEAVNPWSYRGKVELTFSGEPGQIVIGFNRRGSFHRIVDVHRCDIAPPIHEALVALVRDWANRHALAPHHQKRHEGLLRYLVVRQGRPGSPEQEQGPWIAALVTTAPPPDLPLDELVEAVGRLPGQGSFFHVVTDSHAGAVRFDDTRLLMGSGHLEERLGGIAYRVSLESFFQANAEMAEMLVSTVRDLALESRPRHVLDLFCGVGTLALPLAREVERVTGVEAVPEAVRDARRVAEACGVDHAAFFASNAEDFEWAGLEPAVDVAIVDPPRAGMHPRLVRRLAESRLPRLVLVSCNPASLARDLAVLQEAYRVTSIRCLQMFPHTPHVETVAGLALHAPAAGS